jgi:hypothetical protein
MSGWLGTGKFQRRVLAVLIKTGREMTVAEIADHVGAGLTRKQSGAKVREALPGLRGAWLN